MCTNGAQASRCVRFAGAKAVIWIPESGIYWYLTHLSLHLETLKMTRTKVDP